MAFDIELRDSGGGFNIALVTSGAPTTNGYIKVWTGSQWALKPAKVWDGSQWIQKPVKYWSGSVWNTGKQS